MISNFYNNTKSYMLYLLYKLEKKEDKNIRKEIENLKSRFPILFKSINMEHIKVKI